MTDKSIIRFFWIFAAIGIPIFGVSFGHLKLGFFHIAPSFAAILLVFYFSLLTLFIRKKVTFENYFPKSYTSLAYLTYAFLFFHILSFLHSVYAQSDWLDFGLKNLVKIATGYFIFWMTLALFPRNAKFIERFFLITIFSLSALLAVLIYRYAIVFHVPFMGGDYSEYSKGGKNQLAVQVAFFFPFVLSYFLDKKGKSRWLISIPLGIITMSLLYLQSRMGWGAAAFSIIYLIGYTWRCNQLYGFKFATKISLAVLAIGIIGFFVISHFVNLSEISLRVLTIFDPNAIPDSQAYIGKNSYEMRGGIILEAYNAFLTAPIFGVGLGNTFAFIERLTHNDFATILMELGMIGEVLFLLILYFIWKRGQKPVRIRANKIQWLSMATRGSFIALVICLNFFNIYLSPYFWFYLALYIITVETVDPIQNQKTV